MGTYFAMKADEETEQDQPKINCEKKLILEREISSVQRLLCEYDNNSIQDAAAHEIIQFVYVIDPMSGEEIRMTISFAGHKGAHLRPDHVVAVYGYFKPIDTNIRYDWSIDSIVVINARVLQSIRSIRLELVEIICEMLHIHDKESVHNQGHLVSSSANFVANTLLMFPRLDDER
eukprot:516127_1